MPEGQYFREALAGFAAEAAYAGAVRHLYDMGYSVEEIRENLLYPVSRQQIEQVINDYETRRNAPEQDYTYIQETDRYGRKSFRRVKKQTQDGQKDNQSKVHGGQNGGLEEGI